MKIPISGEKQMKISKIDTALLLTISFGEVGAYALIPQPEQAPNESKRVIAEVEENVKANERKKAMQMRDLQEHTLK
jgi:archaellum component FlaC